MTPDDFTEWLDRYCVLFPETTEWLGRLPADKRGPMLAAWAKLMSDVEVRDVMAATERMFAGDEAEFQALGVRFGDRERTPAHVRRLARMNRHERLQREAAVREKQRKREQTLHGGQRRYKYSMADLLRELLRMQEDGDVDAVRKMRSMADELPGPNERGYTAGEGHQDLWDRVRGRA